MSGQAWSSTSPASGGKRRVSPVHLQRSLFFQKWQRRTPPQGPKRHLTNPAISIARPIEHTISTAIHLVQRRCTWPLIAMESPGRHGEAYRGGHSYFRRPHLNMSPVEVKGPEHIGAVQEIWSSAKTQSSLRSKTSVCYRQ